MYQMGHMNTKASQYKEIYPPGTRLLLNYMDDPFSPVPSGTRGTVDFVDDMGQIHMKWDSGRTLAVVPGVDDFRKLTAKELEEERLGASLDEKIKSANPQISAYHSQGLKKNAQEKGSTR